MLMCPLRAHSERTLKPGNHEGEYTYEENLSTIEKEAGEQARVSQEDENARRPRCAQQKKKQRPQAAHSHGQELRTRLKREQRLRDSERIREILRTGSWLEGSAYLLQWAPNGLAYSRLVVIAGRRCGPAHRRNRWRRQAREAFRRSFEECGSCVDIVVRIRTRKTAPSGASLYWELMGAFQETRRRAGDA